MLDFLDIFFLICSDKKTKECHNKKIAPHHLKKQKLNFQCSQVRYHKSNAKAYFGRLTLTGGALKKMVKAKKFPFEVYFHLVKVNLRWMVPLNPHKQIFLGNKAFFRTGSIKWLLCPKTSIIKSDLNSQQTGCFIAF